MIISVKHEIIVLWSAFLCGQAIGFFLDFFRTLRKRFPHGKFAVAVEDVIFCILSFKMFFDVCDACNNGKLRWYIFASLILSGILYFCTASPIAMKIWNVLISVFMCIIYPLRKIIIYFGAFLKRMVSSSKCASSKLVAWFGGNFSKIAKKQHSKKGK